MKVLIIPVLAGKPWNGATIFQEALGGSESAVIYLARALAKQGVKMTVVSHGTPGIFEGVTYRHHSEIGALITNESWDAVISSRWIEALQYAWKTERRILWLHDMPIPGVEYRISATAIVALTEFHKAHWGLDITQVIGDGVDLSLFDGPAGPRSSNALVWISNPDRGAALAAKIFQDIRKRWPDLEFHIYGRASVYGWGPDAESPYLPRPKDMENVFIHEPLPKMGLAKILKEAWAMFYPTYWPETYCIAALEAQAAGTPVVSSPIGGLVETVKGGILTNDFLNAISQLRNKSRWKKLSEAGKAFAQTQSWDIVASKWMEVLTDGES